MFLLKRLALILFDKCGEPVYHLAFECNAVVREAVIRGEVFNDSLVSAFGFNRLDQRGGIGRETIVCGDREQWNLRETGGGVFHSESPRHCRAIRRPCFPR